MPTPIHTTTMNASMNASSLSTAKATSIRLCCCDWNITTVCKIIHAKFNGDCEKPVINCPDKTKLLEFFEKPDWSVIYEGLYKFDANRLQTSLNELKHHSSYYTFFYPGDKKNEIRFMAITEFHKYCSALLKKQASVTLECAPTLQQSGSVTLVRVILNLPQDKVYCRDLDLKRIFPSEYDDLYAAMIKSDCNFLPNGKFCLYQNVAEEATPDMKPLVYMGPPGALTSFHLDGKGLVDAEHFCLTGKNKVILVDRLVDKWEKLDIDKTEAAYNLLLGLDMDTDGEGETKDKDGKTQTTTKKCFLLESPHGNGSASLQRALPTDDNIARCRNKGINVRVIELLPGQVLHINKGRLHAFEKTGLDMCLSIAWDWSFVGISEPGIPIEMKYALGTIDCLSQLNYELDEMHGRIEALGAPKLAIMKLIETLMKFTEKDWDTRIILPVSSRRKRKAEAKVKFSVNECPTELSLLKTALTMLPKIIEKEIKSVENITQSSRITKRRQKTHSTNGFNAITQTIIQDIIINPDQNLTATEESYNCAHCFTEIICYFYEAFKNPGRHKFCLRCCKGVGDYHLKCRWYTLKDMQDTLKKGNAVISLVEDRIFAFNLRKNGQNIRPKICTKCNWYMKGSRHPNSNVCLISQDLVYCSFCRWVPKDRHFAYKICTLASDKKSQLFLPYRTLDQIRAGVDPSSTSTSMGVDILNSDCIMDTFKKYFS